MWEDDVRFINDVLDAGPFENFSFNSVSFSHTLRFHARGVGKRLPIQHPQRRMERT